MTTKYGMFKERTHMPDMKPNEFLLPEGKLPKVVFDVTGGGNREKGLNFKATVGKTGKNNDAAFTKYVSLNEGDKYIETGRRALQAQGEKNKSIIVDKPFKMVSPMKASVGPGDYYGTLSGKVPHEPETVHAPKKKGEIPEQPKGIYTSPGKKGSFGFNKFTISERQGYKGVATEYEYQHDPDSIYKTRRMEEIAKHHKSCVDSKPFRPSNPSKKGTYGMANTTISKGKGIAGEWEYIMAMPPGSAPARMETGGLEGTVPKVKKEDVVPFRPSNAHASKRLTHIPYLHDPLDPKVKKDHETKVNESKRLAATGAWRPNMTYKTDMIRSVVKMNIPRC